MARAALEVGGEVPGASGGVMPLPPQASATPCDMPRSRLDGVDVELSGIVSLERGVDVVAEREPDLRSALDHSCGACHRCHRLEAGDDLVARGSGRESERYGVLARSTL